MKDFRADSNYGNNSVNCFLQALWSRLRRKYSVNIYYTGPEREGLSFSTAGICQKTNRNHWNPAGLVSKMQ